MNEITVEQLKVLLQNNPDLKVLDVREQVEYDEYNVNTSLLPLSKIRNMDIEEIEEWKNDEVVVFCKGGVRSKEACMLLKTFGFSNPVNLIGGLTEWVNQYDVEKMK